MASSAERHLTGDAQEMRGHIAAIRAYAAALRADVLRALEMAQQALALLPTNDITKRRTSMWYNSIMMWILRSPLHGMLSKLSIERKPR